MEKKALDNVNQTVYRQFPYLQGFEPEVSAMENEKYLFIYKGQATTADGHKLPIVIRVTTYCDGKIIKISSSH